MLALLNDQRNIWDVLKNDVIFEKQLSYLFALRHWQIDLEWCFSQDRIDYGAGLRRALSHEIRYIMVLHLINNLNSANLFLGFKTGVDSP